MCGWGPYAREASVWEACCRYSGVINMFLNCPQSTRQIQTTIQRNGPDHLGLLLMALILELPTEPSRSPPYATPQLGVLRRSCRPSGVSAAAQLRWSKSEVIASIAD